MREDVQSIIDNSLLNENQQQQIDVPESLPPPPEALMKKIKKNLFRLDKNGNNKEDKVLIVATANYGMRNHVYNWIESLKKTNEHRFLIFCFDQKLYDHLVLAGYEAHATLIPDVWFRDLQLEAGFKTYFSQEYRVITHAKTLVVQQLLYLDIHVFFSDVDVIWLRKRMVDYVTTLMDLRQETHVLFQQEGLNQQEVNTGFYLMRPTLEMKKLLAETIQIQDAGEKTQQGAMNAALNHLDMDLRTTSIVLLDILHFPNGFAYFDNDLPNKHGIQPYIVHANYLVGEDKKTRLIEQGFWYLNDTWLGQIDAVLEEKYETEQQQHRKKAITRPKNATSAKQKSRKKTH
ncbi:nucleotide-diphospho-sugar transferase-domain-containing protein [Mycotypha africana]|uniref:nucleotide-diphospho-sugar transferase-domain-containing protein n=1 Tax=Mycotypha africana TaxID=64632 RepID=UPI0023018971|nr:nucleotide-diphospho-sugar transferase-domain-containing protein [Mycotypha africana]KAI8968940.1 nucleotide-diphospho-sugar transferase-domain-containing protein [Mycotypha africana]